eukprot:3748263-Amphidinium_carterae.1
MAHVQLGLMHTSSMLSFVRSRKNDLLRLKHHHSSVVFPSECPMRQVLHLDVKTKNLMLDEEPVLRYTRRLVVRASDGYSIVVLLGLTDAKPVS